MSIQPFPFLEGPPISERSRRAVPIAELWNIYLEDVPKQLKH